jgi:acetylornithine deacetylase/succinyl-diaminopimelate desuccinylase-like protein
VTTATKGWAATAFVDAHLPGFLDELVDYCRIPSWGGHDAGMARGAEWLRRKLESLGFAVEVVPREGSHPVVWARLARPGKRKVLFFNHYDIASYTAGVAADPTADLAPRIEGDRVWSRGAADDKGTGLSRVHAVESVIATGALDCDVTFLIEGKKQVGDPTLPPFVDSHVRPLAPDVVIWETGPKDELERPTMSLGAKGYLYLDITATGASRPLFSRMNVFSNPAWDLTWALASLKDREERVTLDGFYDAVRALQPDEERMLDDLVTPDQQKMPADYGLEGFLLAETGRAVMRRLYATPSLTICGLAAGEMGSGVRLAVPQAARCKLEFRLVADQEPFGVLELLRRHLERIGLAHLQLEVLGHSTPYRSPLGDPFVQAVQRASLRVYGRPMVAKPNSTGMSQKYLFKPAPTIGIGVEYWGSRMEATDEHIRIADYRDGILQIAASLEEMAKI